MSSRTQRVLAVTAILLSAVASRGSALQAAPAGNPDRTQFSGCGAGMERFAREAGSPVSPPAPYRTSDGITVRFYPAGLQIGPSAVMGQRLAWVSGNMVTGARLYLSDLRRFHPRLIATSPQCTRFADVRLSPHWLLWNVAVKGQPSWDLWAMSLATGKRRLVARQDVPLRFACAGIGCLPDPGFSLSGDTAVWTELSLTRHADTPASRIMEERLPSRSPRVIVSSAEPCVVNQAPQIAGGVVLWLRMSLGRQGGACNPGSRGEIHLLDLRSGRQRVLTAHSPGRPMTNGWAASWNEGSCVLACYHGTLHLLRLRSGAARVLENLHVKDQTMSGSAVLWLSEDQHGSAMKAESLLSGKLYVLRTTDETPGAPVLEAPGWGWGKTVVWGEEIFPENGPERAYVAVARLP